MNDSERFELLRPRALIRRLRIPRDATIAEIGAGTGFLTLHLVDAVPQGRVIATDIRADRLSIAKRKLAAARSFNVDTRVVPTTETGLLAASIDLAIMCQVDHHLSDRETFLRQLVDSLRKGGRLAIVNFARYYDANVRAIRAASLDVCDEWSPSPEFFLLVVTRDQSRPKARA